MGFNPGPAASLMTQQDLCLTGLGGGGRAVTLGSGFTRGGTMRLLKLFAVLAALTTVAVVGAVAAQADSVGPPWGPATPNFNLEVILRPVAGGPDNSFGLVRFRQPKDADKIVFLDVWVRDLAPNHSYDLQ